MFLTIKPEFRDQKETVMEALKRATGQHIQPVEEEESVVEVPNVGEDQQVAFVERAIGNFCFKYNGRQVGYGRVFQTR